MRHLEARYVGVFVDKALLFEKHSLPMLIQYFSNVSPMLANVAPRFTNGGDASLSSGG